MKPVVTPLKIEKIERRACNKPVYNLAVEGDESFVADNIVVHNCRSILVPVTVIDEWSGKEDRIPAAGTPQDGFK